MSTTTPAATAATEPHRPAAILATVAPPASATATPPWYRRAWVIAVSAVLLAVLSFGSGFVAGNAVSLFGGLIGGPGAGLDGSRFPDGVRPGDGQLPQFPRDAPSPGDGS